MIARMLATLALAALLGGATACTAQESQPPMKPPTTDRQKLATALFGSGCFWCVEAVFERVDGVAEAINGYAGGKVENPTYQQVCSGTTGHAEVVQIAYDPAKVTYEQLLDIFFATHDPTTLNRQGNDFGTQYRSVIFALDAAQRQAAEAKIAALNQAGKHAGKIVTEVAGPATFYPAEAYHQDYFENNPNQPYCRLVIAPKIDKFEAWRRK